MKTKALKRGLNAFNLLFVATFMVLALYSAIGQQIFPFIGQYRATLENYLGEQLDGDVSIRQLSGGMDILTPSVHIEGVTLYTDDYPDQPKVSIAAIDAVLDPRSSLINLTPVFKSVRLSGLYVRVDGDNKKPQEPIEEDDAKLIKRLIDGLLLQQHVELNNVTIENVRGNETKVLQLDHLMMTGDGFNRLITGNVSYGDENKVNAGIRLYSQGSPFKLDSFYARGALDLPDVDVDYWLDEIFDVSIFKEFSASAQLRFEFENGLLNYSKLSVASPTVYINDGRKINAVNAQLWGKQNAVDNWSFWVKDSQFTLKDKVWQFNDVALGISKTTEGNRWQTYIKSMDVDYLHQFLVSVNLLPKDLTPLLAQLAPTGRVENMNVIMQNKANGKMTFTLAGEVKNISTQPRGGIPGLTNVNGVIAATENSGRVQFDGPKVSVAFPSLYPSPFYFPHAKGQVDWFNTDQGVRLTGDGLSFSMEEIESIKGGFKVWLYDNEQFEDKLELNLSLTKAEVSAHKVLVPSVLSESLRTWFDQALLSGKANTGQFYLYTGLNKDSNSQSELQLNMSKVAMQYLPEWPIVSSIDGDIFVQNDHAYARINKALSLGGDVTQTQVIFEHNTLWVQSSVQGSAGEGVEYFQHTPLQSIVDNVLDPWSMTGNHLTQLGLHIPLDGGGANIIADVNTKLSNASLNMADVGLTFDQTQGSIAYRSSKGLTSSAIRTQLWQQPLVVNISSTVHDIGFSSDIAFDGNVEMDSLKQWLDLSLLKPLSGSTLVSGHFKISGQDNGFTGLEVDSNLNGVDVKLPEPFFKDKNTKRSFKLRMALDEGQKIKLAYGDNVNLALHVKQGEVRAGQVYLGSTEAYIPNVEGIEILGHVTQINGNQWLQVWKDIQPKASGKKVGPNKSLLRKIDISADRFIYDGYHFDQISTEINARQDAWDIYIEAPLIKGLVTWSQNKPINLDLNYIHWPALVDVEDDDKNSGPSDPLVNIFPSMFPDVDLKVDEIFLGPINYGAWKGKIRSKGDTLSLSDIDGKIKKLGVKGQITWVKPNDIKMSQSTLLNLKLSSDDVGGIQKAWRAKPVIEAKDAKVNLDFQWQASPLAVNTHVLNGQANFSLKDGRFLDAGDTGALSAFGILNFGAVGRRLRLDFSDVYQSGLHFDSVSGKVKIKDGLMTIIDTLDIKGPSAKFAASGTVNLNTKVLNQELSVTFPITSTLPFVAILAGFAPPVAASLFVGEQLVGDQIEKYTSATYKLDGTWDEPNLQLMKRFDNDIEGKQDQGFWYRMKDFFGLGGGD
jgi:uncharacterized protein (TIGR02099 family)